MEELYSSSLLLLHLTGSQEHLAYTVTPLKNATGSNLGQLCSLDSNMKAE